MLTLKKWLKFWTPFGLLPFYYRSRYPDGRVPSSVPYLLPRRSLLEVMPEISTLEFNLPLAEVFRHPDMVLPLAELLSVIAICKSLNPKRVFEIGTFTGSTTLALAMNTRPESTIYTLDLPLSAEEQIRKNSDKTGIMFQNAPEAMKIKQLWGDSSKFDFTPYFGQMDLVFVDGNHTAEFVRSDSENAFKLIRPGGIILWDDYIWDERHAGCAGVTEALNLLGESKAIFNLIGTRLVMYEDEGKD